MSTLKSFLLQCSGVDIPTLEKCPSDENKYVGIGATVLFTAILAFCSSAYALHTIFNSVLMAVIFGTVWAMMIFNLDRYIVGSMKKYGNIWGDLGVALPRLAMAVLLALVISTPLELKIFEKEINAELIVMEQEVFKTQEDRVGDRYQSLIDDQQAELEILQAAITEKTVQRNQLEMMAIQEADGTGGSRNKNLGPIYKAKKAEAEKANSELAVLIAQSQPIIDKKIQEIESIRLMRENDIANLDRSGYGGIAARMDALSRLSAASNAIALASIFITLLFIAIETAPIFVKLIAHRSPYDFLIDEKEFVFAMANKEQKAILKNSVIEKIKYETEVTTHRNNTKITVEKSELDAALEQRLSELKEKGFGWNNVVPT